MLTKDTLHHLLHKLSHNLIERESAIRMVLLATLAGEHVLLLGPPGTAKSELARRLKHAILDAKYFERLLTRFSVPEELFGPLSIKNLEQDRYTRLTDNYLPTASIAFIDEIFKANSAILNSLLTLLNEREFDNGDQRIKTPLAAVVAASNELPQEEELDALYDRFLVRIHVSPVSEQGFSALLNIQGEANCNIPENAKLSQADLNQIQEQAQKLPLSKEVMQLLKNFRQYLLEKDIYVSDRRWRKIVKLLQTAAYTNGQSEVSIWECWLLQYCAWQMPEQQALIFDWYQSQIGISEIVDLQSLYKLTDVWQKTLEEEKSKTKPLLNKNGEKLYCNPKGGVTTESGHDYLASREGEPLYLAPSDVGDRSLSGRGLTRGDLEKEFFDDYYQQRHIDGKWVDLESYIKDPDNRLSKRIKYDLCTEAAKFSIDHINDRCQELAELGIDIENHQQHIDKMLEALENQLPHHLWVDNAFSETARSILLENQSRVNSLKNKIEAIQLGFKQLPVAA